MDKQNIIKMISPSICPHCNKEILISNKMTAPWVDWVLKKEDIDKAKESVKKIVLESKAISAQEQTSVIEWLDNEDTLFGPEEVEIILQQILHKDEEKKEEVKK